MDWDDLFDKYSLFVLPIQFTSGLSVLLLLHIAVDKSLKHPAFGSRMIRVTACKFNMQNISDFTCLIGLVASKLRLLSLLSLFEYDVHKTFGSVVVSYNV